MHIFNLKEKKGFIALTELIVIIGVIIILTGVAIPTYFIARRQARIAHAIADMGNIIAPACHQFKVDVWTRFPANSDGINRRYGLLSNPFNPATEAGEYARWGGPYIKEGFTFRDPWRRNYEIYGDGVNYCIIVSAGADRTPQVTANNYQQFFDLNKANCEWDSDRGRFLNDKDKQCNDDLAVVVVAPNY